MRHIKLTSWIMVLLPIFLVVLVIWAPHVLAQGEVPTTGLGGDEQTVWEFIKERPGIINLWRLSLGLVDLLVVAGLVIASFSNIFRINIKNYEIKQILPGLIIGVILANLSFFIMRLFLDGASVLTQFIGELGIRQMGGTVTAESAGRLILKPLTYELLKSLFTLPEKVAGLVIGGSIAAFFTGPGTVVAVIAIAGLLLLVLAPLILYLIIIFLLYVRNYVLVVMFILAPLAFFALGYPPFKAWWQKWWGTFWQWLLMAPVVHLLLAFAAIFLHYANLDLGAPGTGGRGLTDYIFVNGVAIGILYFAMRIPFIWGKFFGIAKMEDWVKGNKYVAGKGSNFVWDRGAQARAGIQANMHRYAGADNPSDYRKKMRELMDQGKNRDQARKILQKRYAATLYDKYAAQAPARQLQGGANLFKNWKEGVDKREENLAKQSPLSKRFKRPIDFKGYVDDQSERFKKEFEDNEDLGELKKESIKLWDLMRNAGVDPAQAKAIMKKAQNTSNIAKLIQDNPALSDQNLEDVIKHIHGLKQLRKAYTAGAANRKDAKKENEDFIDNLGGASGGVPFAPGGGPAGPGGTPGGGGSPFAPGGGPVPVSLQSVAQNAYDNAHISAEEKDLLSGFGAKSKDHFDATYTEPSEAALRATMLGMNMSEARVNTVLASLRARATDPNIKSFGSPREYGPEFENMEDAQRQVLSEQMRGYGKAIRGRQALIYGSIEADSKTISAERIANNFSAKASADADAEAQKLKGLDQDLERLEKVLAGEPNSDNLRQVHSGLSGHDIPVLDIPKPGEASDNFEVQSQLKSRVEAARAAVMMNQNALANNVTVREVVTHQQATDVSLKQIMETIEHSQQELGSTIADGLAEHAAASSEGIVKSLMASAPEFNNRAKPVVIDNASIKSVAEKIVNPITARLVEKQKQDANWRGIDSATDQEESKAMKQMIQSALHEAATQHQSLEMSQAQVASAPQTQASTEAAPAESAPAAETSAAPAPQESPIVVSESAPAPPPAEPPQQTT